MQVIHQLWKGRRVRVAGALEQISVDCPDDLAAIYRDYWELVYRRCEATLKDEEAALDATQDVFLAALASFEEIRHDVVRGLLDLARTISYERKRRPAREVPLADPSRSNGHHAADPAEIAERNGVLSHLWSELSEVERRYVADKWAGFSFEEMAQRNRRALGTVSSNLARAREHARRIGEPLLLGGLAALAWRRLAALGRRARNAAQDTSVVAAAQPVGSLTVSLTLAGLIAGAVPVASVAQAPAGRPLVPAAASASAELAVGNVPASGLGHQAAVGMASAPGAQPSSGAGSRIGLPLLTPNSPASAETPEDTEIVSATPSPDYQQDHTIVALGHGAACSCEVLLMSTDGGATWSARQGPPAGTQVVLAPTFPQDPAIYVGYSSGTGGQGDYWSAGFGAPFQPLGDAPPGALAMAAGFDRGDNRLFVANPAGVWSYETRSRLVTPLLVETGNVTPSLATPSGAADLGVVVMTTAQAVAAGSGPDPGVLSGGEALWACPPSQPCRHTSTVGLRPGAQLALSPEFGTDSTLLAFNGAQLLGSSNGGGSFSDIALPSTAAGTDSVLLAPSSQGTGVWATVGSGTAWRLLSRPSLAAPWREMDGGDPAIVHQGGQLLVAGAQKLLFLLAQGGLRCSVNGGVTWGARCPAA